MSSLIDSFKTQLKSIRAKGSVAVKGPNSWYHTFDTKIVAARIEELKQQIKDLEKKHAPE